MTIEIKELVSNGSVLIDLTDAESSKVNGGYASFVTLQVGPDQGAAAYGIVLNQRASDRRVIDQQLAIGIPEYVTEQGTFLAENAGGGVYTPGVSFSKLDG
jgi:hypothetical protein